MRLFLTLGLLIFSVAVKGQTDSCNLRISFTNICNDLNHNRKIVVVNDSSCFMPRVVNNIYIYTINKLGLFNINYIDAEGWESTPLNEIKVNNFSKDTIDILVTSFRITTNLIEKHPHPLFLECNKPANGNIYEYYINGNIRFQGTFKNGHPIDSVLQYYPNGKCAFKYKTVGFESNNNTTEKYFSDGSLKEEIIRNEKGTFIKDYYYDIKALKSEAYFPFNFDEMGYSIDYDEETGKPVNKVEVQKNDYKRFYFENDKWVLYEQSTITR